MKIKVPTSWSGVTLGQYIELVDMKETDKPLDDFAYRIAILSDNTMEYVKDTIKARQVNRYVARIEFIGSMPKVKNTRFFWFNLKCYKCDSIANTKGHQAVDILQSISNEENEGRKILKVLSTIYYRGNKSEFNQDYHDQMMKDFLELPMNVAYSATFFF